MSIRDIVFEALDNAVANGYNHQFDTPDEVCDDLCDKCSDVEKYITEAHDNQTYFANIREVHKCVAEWQEANRDKTYT